MTIRDAVPWGDLGDDYLRDVLRGLESEQIKLVTRIDADADVLDWLDRCRLALIEQAKTELRDREIRRSAPLIRPCNRILNDEIPF